MNFVLFLLTFIALLIIYEIMIIKDEKSRKSKKKNSKGLVEVRLLEYFFKVPVERIKYERLVQVIAFVSSFDIALIVTIVCLITSIGILQILLGMVILLPILFGSYYVVSVIYKKSLRGDKNE